MKIAIGSDHRGFDAKERIRTLIERLGHSVVDRGMSSRDACDYPDMGGRCAGCGWWGGGSGNPFAATGSACRSRRTR